MECKWTMYFSKFPPGQYQDHWRHLCHLQVWPTNYRSTSSGQFTEYFQRIVVKLKALIAMLDVQTSTRLDNLIYAYGKKLNKKKPKLTTHSDKWKLWNLYLHVLCGFDGKSTKLKEKTTLWKQSARHETLSKTKPCATESRDSTQSDQLCTVQP